MPSVPIKQTQLFPEEKFWESVYSSSGSSVFDAKAERKLKNTTGDRRSQTKGNQWEPKPPHRRNDGDPNRKTRGTQWENKGGPMHNERGPMENLRGPIQKRAHRKERGGAR